MNWCSDLMKLSNKIMQIENGNKYDAVILMNSSDGYKQAQYISCIRNNDSDISIKYIDGNIHHEFHFTDDISIINFFQTKNAFLWIKMSLDIQSQNTVSLGAFDIPGGLSSIPGGSGAPGKFPSTSDIPGGLPGGSFLPIN